MEGMQNIVGERRNKMRYYCEICHEEYDVSMFTDDECKEICNNCYSKEEE